MIIKELEGKFYFYKGYIIHISKNATSFKIFSSSASGTYHNLEDIIKLINLKREKDKNKEQVAINKIKQVLEKEAVTLARLLQSDL